MQIIQSEQGFSIWQGVYRAFRQRILNSQHTACELHFLQLFMDGVSYGKGMQVRGVGYKAFIRILLYDDTDDLCTALVCRLLKSCTADVLHQQIGNEKIAMRKLYVFIQKIGFYGNEYIVPFRIAQPAYP